jgi:hypothetical protein
MRKQGLLPIIMIVAIVAAVGYFGVDRSQRAVVELGGKCILTLQQMWAWLTGMFRLT